jgi:hypothetical protein
MQFPSVVHSPSCGSSTRFPAMASPSFPSSESYVLPLHATFFGVNQFDGIFPHVFPFIPWLSSWPSSSKTSFQN